jgi:hypothetical protein
MGEGRAGVAPWTRAPAERVGWGFMTRYVLAFASTTLALVADVLPDSASVAKDLG